MLFVFGIVLALTISKSYDGHNVFSVRLTTLDQMAKLNDFQRAILDLEFWDRPNLVYPFKVMIGPNNVDRFREFLEDNEIAYYVVVENAGR